ncbi:MAG: hypothetical protein CL596_05170 [Alteromonas sp.]|nr:hypothetical protein [Alteromonas sp.]|tara:strand:- start:15138 stop:15626 length:489 start_codon:yes stop_codon:yes gene_type:complete
MENSNYTFEDFEKEREHLLQYIEVVGKKAPSKEFCQMFFNRITKGWELSQEKWRGDLIDYHAWGYAFYGDIDYNGEIIANSLNIWHWLSVYGINGTDPEEGVSIEITYNQYSFLWDLLQKNKTFNQGVIDKAHTINRNTSGLEKKAQDNIDMINKLLDSLTE